MGTDKTEPQSSASPQSPPPKGQLGASITVAELDEAAKRAARHVRFSHPSQSEINDGQWCEPEAETPPVEPTGVASIFTASHDGAPLLLLVEEISGPRKGAFGPPGGKMELGDFSTFERAVNETSEEIGPKFSEALVASGKREPELFMYKTAVFVTDLPRAFLDFEHDPQQQPPETSAMGWFDPGTLSKTLDGLVKDSTGAIRPCSKYAAGLARRLLQFKWIGSSSVNEEVVTPCPAVQPSRRARTSVRAPSKSMSTVGLALLHAAATDASGALPFQSLPTRFERELSPPFAPDFVWPACTHFSFYDHTGAVRNYWSSCGYSCMSVADRRTNTMPLPGSYHVVMPVREFVAMYPHPLGLMTSSVTCAPAAWAAWPHWAANVLDGSILEKAEEILWNLCLGARAAAEQPPTAHARLLGEPAFKTTAERHGGRLHKTYWIWERGLCVPPEQPARPAFNAIADVRTSDPEESMLMRSAFEDAVAASWCSAWDVGKDVWQGQPTRPASQLCNEYEDMRASLLHNYSIFASRYAPRLELSRSASSDCSRIVVVPMRHHSAGMITLAPLVCDAWGVDLRDGCAPLDEATGVSRFLGGGSPMLACKAKGAGGGVDWIFVLAASTVPVVLASPSEILEARQGGAEAVWCCVSNAAMLSMYPYLLACVRRLRQLQGATDGLEQPMGTRGAAQPIVQCRAATQWNSAALDDDTLKAWERLVAKDKQTCAVFGSELSKLDSGDGIMHMFAAKLKCMADLQAEIPLPLQGPPDLSIAVLRFALFPQRPPPLLTAWLTKLPPQPVPPGAPLSLSWTDILRAWARRKACSALTRNATYDLDMWRGTSPSTRRAPTLALGRAAAHQIAHADGVGSYNAFDVVRERGADGMYYIMDFDAKYQEHKNNDFLRMLFVGPPCAAAGVAEEFGDQELLSLAFEGMRYKAAGGQPPRRLLLCHNVQSLDERIRGVADVIVEHVKLNMTRAMPIVYAPPEGTALTGFDPDGLGPFFCLPGFNVGIGGVDKADCPGVDGEKRRVGNSTDPQNELHETTEPHGEPSGELVINFNDMTGPSKLPPGYDGPPVPWPDPETKFKPRHGYAADAVLGHMALLAGLMLVGIKDDIRWMFWQFWLAASERWMVTAFMWLLLDGRLCYCSLMDLVMTMGVRPSSKVACRFAEEFLDKWRVEFSAWIAAVWLPKQTRALQELLIDRHARLGAAQAQPFWAGPFSDDFKFTYLGAEQGAMGHFLWRRQCTRAGLLMSTKVGGGTVVDWIGGRNVLNGGFGCLVPHKRLRMIAECTEAMAGRRTLDQLISTNSYAVHVADIEDLRAGSMKGIRGPVTAAERMGRHGDDLVVVEGFAAFEVYADLISQLQRRSGAAFTCAIHDAPRSVMETGTLRVHCESDSCSDVPNPHVCGGAGGIFFRFKLTPRWLQQHITLTEALGPAFGSIVWPVYFPESDLVHGTDSDAALAMMLGKARAPSLVLLRKHLERDATFAASRNRQWAMHVPGIANDLYDLGSRDRMIEMRMLAAAFGIRLIEIKLPPAALDMAANVLDEVETSMDVKLELEAARDKRARAAPSRSSSRPSNRSVVSAGLVASLPSATGLAHTNAVPSGAHAVQTALCLLAAAAVLALALYLLAAILRQPVRVNAMRMKLHLRGGAGASSGDSPEQIRGPPRGATHRTPACAASPDRLHATPRRRCCSSNHLDADSPDPISRSSGTTARRAGRAPDVESPPARPISAEPARPPRSPQPTTAAAARRAAAENMARVLTSDDTAYALFPNAPGTLRELTVESERIRSAGIPIGTLKADEVGFKAVMNFCSRTDVDTPWMRPEVVEPKYRKRETLFYGLALIAVACMVKPGKHTAEKGATRGLPSTALGYIYSYMRVMRDCGRWVPDLHLMLATLKGLNHRFKQQFGQDALIPRRTQPFSLKMLHSMASALVRRAIRGWSDVMHSVILTLMCFCLATGTRCNEWASAGPEDTYLRRSNFSLFKQGTEVEMSDKELNSVRNGDFIKGHSAPSKADRDNTAFGACDQWFRVNFDDPLNFASRWVQWELAYPCPSSERTTWPAFSPTGTSTPFTTSAAASLLQALMVATIGAAEAALRSWHAFRVTIACALLSLPLYKENPAACEALIQAMVRWKTNASVKIYARLQPGAYADHVDYVTSTDAHRMASMRNTVVIDPREAFDDIDRAEAQLASDIASARKKKAEAKSVQPCEPGDAAPPAAAPSKADTKATKPTSKRAAAGAPLREFDCVGEGAISATDLTAMSAVVNIPNKVWEGFENDSKTSACSVVGRADDHTVTGASHKGAYVVEHLGSYYAFETTFYPFNKLNKRGRSSLQSAAGWGPHMSHVAITMTT